MNVTRRQFLKATAATAAVASVGGFLSPRRTYAFNQSPGIPLFKTTLRGVGPGQIPVASPGPLPAPVTGVTHYQMLISQFQDQILPPGFNRTTLWGYKPVRPLGGGFQPQKHLGGIIVGQKGNPIQITFHNQLFVNKHIIPVDTTIPGANQAVNRTAIHLHGGLVPWISDGGPFDWFGPLGTHGLSFLNNRVLNPIHLPGAAEYYYPLSQSARFMWYHDHAVGITRLNAYAGLASAMLIRDGFELNLINDGLPNYIEAGGNELPLVFQDKIFVDDNINAKDPGWSSMVQAAATKPGSLWYAHTYEPNQPDGSGRWDLQLSGLPLPDPSNIPEFFADTMLVNGTAYPQATVQARRYRLRMLNACNARFLNLQLYVDDGSLNGITLDTTSGVPTNNPFVNAATGRPTWLQIGTEGGFLAKPVEVPSNVPFLITDRDFLNGGPSLNPSLVNKSLIVAPAERPDLIIDFTGYAGQNVILYSDAPAPFPSGDDRNDYFPGWNTQGVNGYPAGAFGLGNPVNGTTPNGCGPNTRVLMRFKVIDATDPADGILKINSRGTSFQDGIDPTLLPVWGYTNHQALYDSGIAKRVLTLNEYFDEYGRLIQILGNDAAPFGSPYFGSASYFNYGVPAVAGLTAKGSTEETVRDGDLEVWEVFNTTGDVHPMHFHLVNVQVINRQTFDPTSYPYNFTGRPIPPEPNEVGWKETVPMYPGTVTRVIMKWDMASIVDKNGNAITTNARPIIGQLPIKKGVPPVSPRTGSHEYVWHCHILEHEEHDMMHTINVLPKP